jgi:6-phosphogluconolactonase (cycloisomerase 2 family)
VQVPGSPFTAGQGATAAAFSPNGRLLAVADYNLNAVSVYSVVTDGRLRRVPGSPFPTGAGPVSLAFSPSGRTLAIADLSHNAVTLDAVSADGRLTAQRDSPVPLAGPPYAVAYSPNGRLLAVADSTGDAIQIFGAARGGTLSSGSATEMLPSGSDPTSVQFSPNSQLLAVAEHGADAIAAYSLAQAKGASLPSLTAVANSPFATGEAADTVSFNREGTVVAASDYNAAQIELLDINASSGLSTAPDSPIATGPGSGPDGAVFSPTADTLAVALGTANTTALYRAGAAAVPAPLTGSPYPAGTGPTAVAFNSQGTLLATVNIYSNSVSIYASTAAPPAVVRLLSTRARVRHGRVAVTVSCAATVDGAAGHLCSGRLSLSWDRGRLVAARFRVKPGRTATLSFRLPSSVTRLTARHHRVTLVQTASARGASTASRALSLTA